VCNPAYSYPECKILFIAERSAPEEYQSGPGQLELKDEEIESIRTALQKIIRRRILNANDAEDLVQDTLLTMIIRYPGKELEKGLLIWSQGILRNKVGNYYRKSRRHTSFEEHHTVVQPQDMASPAIKSPEITASNNELQSIIDEKLAEFPPAIHQVMKLLVSGLDAGEIADQLSPEPYQNIINRLYRGRKRLARELIKCGFGPGSGNRRDRKMPGENRTGISRKVS
jgi:RNA polymerase sigma factor (sigma-70 family)